MAQKFQFCRRCYWQTFVRIARIAAFKVMHDSPFDRIRFVAFHNKPRKCLPPLHLAAFFNNVKQLKELVPLYRACGKSINHVYCGYTALDMALRENHYEATEFLLQQPDTCVGVKRLASIAERRGLGQSA